MHQTFYCIVTGEISRILQLQQTWSQGWPVWNYRWWVAKQTIHKDLGVNDMVDGMKILKQWVWISKHHICRHVSSSMRKL